MPSTIQVFEIQTSRAVKTVSNTHPSGLFTAGDSFLAFPDEKETGTVTVISTTDFEVTHKIRCHTRSIRMLSAGSGDVFMTASQKGTLVRVFNSGSGERIAEFRRGLQGAQVLAMASDGDSFVACSETTVHVFAEGHHVKIAPKAAPVACFVKDQEMKLVTVDGTIAIYTIEGGNGLLALEVKTGDETAPRPFKVPAM